MNILKISFDFSGSSSHGLPLELWEKIIDDVCLISPYRNSLHPLLFVSHIFRNMATPLIYESILVIIDDDDQIKSSEFILGINEPCTYLSPARLHLLRFALENNPQLATYTKTLVEIHSDSDPSNQICHILSQLTSLQQLELCHQRPQDIPSLLAASIALTHFSCSMSNRSDPSSLRSFLSSQSLSLISLSLDTPMRGLVDFLPPSMARLHSFSSIHTAAWDTLVEIAPIKHLESSVFSAPAVRNPQLVFCNLVSLKLGLLYETNAIRVIGPYLKSLRLLHLSFVEDDNKHIAIEDLMNIASPLLSYIHFGRNAYLTTSNPTFDTTTIRPLFAQYSSLSIVDITYRHRRHALSTQSPISRYFRNGTVHVAIDTPPPWTFEGWWEPLMPVLDLNFYA
ncbi:hypothetical protein ONZ45_g13904 [Pleurotus djamor]|nr:hypothetical protein ONZ45_g13904 [Pleurotus djamor]